jgi:hypothetical protein
MRLDETTIKPADDDANYSEAYSRSATEKELSAIKELRPLLLRLIARIEAVEARLRKDAP